MRKSVFIILSFVCSSFVSSCADTPPNRIEALRYKKEILEHRQDKDKFLKKTPDSPLAQEQQWEFTGLSYYPVDINYRVKANYTKIADPVIFKITTSSGSDRVYIKTGRLDFELYGKKLSLMTYQDKQRLDEGNGTGLFVPYTDSTSGLETYGAGRYLDIELPKADVEIFLDFNLSYNPYCAYNHNFSCPIPPEENNLAVAITAGEKKFPLQVF